MGEANILHISVDNQQSLDLNVSESTPTGKVP